MSCIRTARRILSRLLFVVASAAALAASGISAQEGQVPCEECAGGFDGGFDGDPGLLPSATIIARTPCAYTPHDVNPCFNLRCYLFPEAPITRYYAYADIAPLFRDPNRDVVFQRLNAQTADTPATPFIPGRFGEPVLTSGTPDPEFQAGLRFTFGGRLNDVFRVETSFLGFQDWDDTATARNFAGNGQGGQQGNLFSPFSGFGSTGLDALGNPNGLNGDGGDPGIVGFDYNNSATLNVSSTFDSVEMNGIVNIPRMRNLVSSVSLGVRYIRIDEGLAYLTASDVPAGTGSTVAIRNSVNNEMIGLQLGYRAQFFVEQRMWLNYDMKGAIYQDDIDYSLNYLHGGADVDAFAGKTNLQKTAFGGEAGLVLNYLITPSFSVRLGYQAMWFTGLGLAAENAIPEGVRVSTPAGGPNRLIFPPLQINHAGEVVYHGPVAGIMAMW